MKNTDVPVHQFDSVESLPQSITAAESAAKFGFPSEHSDQVNTAPPPPKVGANIDPPSVARPSGGVGKTTSFTGTGVKGTPVDKF